MKKDGGSESTIIIGPSKSVLVYALHSLVYVLGLARFRVFVPKLLLLFAKFEVRSSLRSDAIMITTDGRTDDDQISPRKLGSQINISMCYTRIDKTNIPSMRRV